MASKDDQSASGIPDLVNEQELASKLKVSRSWLRTMRVKGIGPEYFKLGASVRYSMADVLAWMNSSKSAA